ncbi:MAG TPA: FAD-dependent oxidoreductase [Candidatus Paceibacterota bacterium]|nr:FAD-dependent oxidoreductase [Verrucomicrobiota bacterium]HOX02363.1 FAD-dependent oxidoreductase [Verrucomicrobiota bacterium]HRZ43698.1 FAD-dependent oxidoreductase [Candidatus Paceibacterota bacterium]HRZ94277.1 FAD-dependent oxidoreductase [Candidatus Paceibacterota bacterium]
MKQLMTRRQLLRLLAAAGLGPAIAQRTVADLASPAAARPKIAENQLAPPSNRPCYPAVMRDGRVIQPERPLAVIEETEVLVVGGGPAGFAAAVAAARAGARTALVERYGYFGGQWTGGLVLLVISSHAREDGRLVKVLQGVGGELLDRLSKIDGAIVHHKPDQFNPTTDPEATKFMMDEMIREAGVKVFLHCWVADVVMEGPVVRGVVFESKAGRQAILARVVIDATGDGDVFAAAGAEHERRFHAIGLVHRLGNADRAGLESLRANGIKSIGSIEPLPAVKWINLRGPSTDCLDIAELTRLEMEHRRSIWLRAQQLRQKPGGEPLFLLQTAPQLGVRISRLLAGVQQLTYEEARQGRSFPNTIAVGGAQNAHHRGWPIPYGVLIPRTLDQVIAAGRCICVDEKLIEDMRLLASCLTTGHAAGAAAALAVKTGRRPREVDIAQLQQLLLRQGAYLG